MVASTTVVPDTVSVGDAAMAKLKLAVMVVLIIDDEVPIGIHRELPMKSRSQAG